MEDKNKLRVLVGQMTSTDNLNDNLAQIERIIVGASNHPEMAFFPENCLYMRLKEGAKIDGITIDNPVFEKLKNISQSYGIGIHLGSVPLKEGAKLSNASIFISSKGELSIQYRKIHLFDIQLEGGKSYKESDVFNFGESPSILDERGWRFGQTICYDLRFAELYSRYAKVGVEVMLVPAAFLVETGRAHWEVLLRARAIESQAYVIAAAQAGTHRNQMGDERSTFGNSLVVDPWGTVLVRGAGDKVEGLEVELDRSKLGSVRKQIPMASHRRL